MSPVKPKLPTASECHKSGLSSQIARTSRSGLNPPMNWRRRSKSLSTRKTYRKRETWSKLFDHRESGPPRCVPASSTKHMSNPFLFDINICVPDDTGGQRKVMKRVLVDSGSDLNLISHDALRSLESPARPLQRSVQSLAGTSAIVGEASLTWTFLLIRPRAPSTHSDRFYVLAKSEHARFDCILSHIWIMSNIDVFTALLSSRVPRLAQ